jgi:hypothetical protein
MNPRELSESLVTLGRDVLGYLDNPCEERRQAIFSLMAALLVATESSSAVEVYQAVKRSPSRFEAGRGPSGGGNSSRVSRGSLAG